MKVTIESNQPLQHPYLHNTVYRYMSAEPFNILGTAEEGIVVGGGCILLRFASKVDAIKGTLAEDKEKKALSCLLNLTAKNAGVYGSVVIEKVLSSYNQKNCHNNAADTYKDLFLAVIIDPTKLTFPAGKPMDNSGFSVFFSIQPSETFSMKDSETLSMNDPLTAVNNATQASDRLHQVFTMQSLHRKQQSDFCATTSSLYITRVGCFYCILKDSEVRTQLCVLHAVVVQIQKEKIGWQKRKEFLLHQQRVVKI
ncbi:unnamed protein product [Brassica rapa subsp. trilocularis]